MYAYYTLELHLSSLAFRLTADKLSCLHSTASAVLELLTSNSISTVAFVCEGVLKPVYTRNWQARKCLVHHPPMPAQGLASEHRNCLIDYSIGQITSHFLRTCFAMLNGR